MTTLRPSRSQLVRERLRGSWRVIVKEVASFGVIGAVAFVIDIGLFAWLSPYGALKAKALSTLVSTTFAYFGNRYLSFSHRARTSLAREASAFFGINLVTLVFSELILAFVIYVLGHAHASAEVFAVNLVTIGLGTVFRFWAYKRFVFLHPDRVRTADADLDVELAE